MVACAGSRVLRLESVATTTAQLDRSATQERVLEIVREVLQELGSIGALPMMRPGSHLDR